MRSLAEWTRYLEEQEQVLHDAPSSSDTEEKQVEAPVAGPPPAGEKRDPPQREQPLQRRKSPRRAERKPSTKVAKPAAKRASDEKLREKRPIDKGAIKEAMRLRKRLPTHLDTASIEQNEVAEASYKAFKGTREELIRRLLDPELSLEDVSRILNVCPTTVRRYTNRGLLGHHRTAGNQRRFRLSDVLAFLESQSGGSAESGGGGDTCSA